MHIFKNTNFDFLRWRVPALLLSATIILAGVAAIAVKGLPLGIEFSGGTVVIVKFPQGAPEIQAVRAALNRTMPGEGESAVIQRYGREEDNSLLVRVSRVGAEAGGALSQAADQVVAGLKGANLGNLEVIGTEIVGPVVGQDLTRKGIMATILSLIGILLYIAFRFRFSFAVGAVVATIHDLLVTLAFLAFFRYDLSLNVIAGILTVTGYSVNDTIVIFDRVRENLRSMRRDNLNHIINTGINQTLGRTIITAGTALLSSVALFLFGGEVLRGFAFTMVVGIITGTYSTVFIAAAIVTFWRSGKPARHEAPATPAAPQAVPVSARKKAKKAKAS